MRIALAVEGTRGDVHPMLSLGNALQAAGHEAVLCGPRNFATSALQAGLEFREVGGDTREFLESVAGAIASRGLAASRAHLRYFVDSLDKQFTRLPQATEDVDLILGAGVQLAASSAAELHGAAYRYVMFCPVMVPSADHAPPFLPTQAMPRWLNRLAWWLMRGPLDRLMCLGLNRARRRYLGLGKIESFYRYSMSERPILAADPVLAPMPLDGPLQVQQVGCLHEHDPEPLPEKLEEFLSQGSPPVYVGFGSMTDPNPAATTRLALRAVERAGCRAILSQGWAGLGAGGLPETVIGIGAVSHAALFPRCAAAVHHGGAGTTTRVAQAGIPQIVVPHLLDQYWWGKRIANMGLAPAPLPRASLGCDQLGDGIASVLDNEFLSQRAEEIGRQIAPQPTPMSAAAQILASVED